MAARKLEFDQPPAVVILPMPETRPTGLEIIRCLGRAGVPVLAMSSEGRPPSFSSRYVQHRLRCPNPRQNERSFVEYLTSLGRRATMKPVIFASGDYDATIIVKYQETLREFFRYPYVPMNVLEQCIDKRKMYQVAEDVGMILPETKVVERSDDIAAAVSEAALPSVIKPIARFQREGHELQKHMEFISVFGSKAIRVHNCTELAKALDAAVEAGLIVLVQEEVLGPPNHLYLICVYADQRSRVRAVFTGRKIRQYPADFGSGSLTKAVSPPQDLVKLAEAFVQRIGYRGIANFEWKWDESSGQYKFMEVNPRCWTWTVLAEICGVNLPHIAYLDLIGEQIPETKQQMNNAIFVDIVHDIKYFLRYRRGDIMGRTMTLRDYLHSLKEPKEYAFFAKEDRSPGWRHLWRQLPGLLRLLASTVMRRKV